MPVYLCKPGWNAEEPWRHGVQVYESPFPMTDDDENDDDKDDKDDNDDDNNDTVVAGASLSHTINNNNNNNNNRISGSRNSSSSYDNKGVVIRRVRHSEVVLVDQVSIAYNRYWLRLQWPGSRGGMAGYIALGTLPSTTSTTNSNGNSNNNNNTDGTNNFNTNLSSLLLQQQQQQQQGSSSTTRKNDIISPPIELSVLENATRPMSAAGESDAEDVSLTIIEEEEEDIDDDDLVHSSSATELKLKCVETGLEYPCSQVMELLRFYHDGLLYQNTSTSTGNNAAQEEEDILTNNNTNTNNNAATILSTSNDHECEPVFCRICREGLHDVNYDNTPQNDDPNANAMTANITNANNNERDQPETGTTATTNIHNNDTSSSDVLLCTVIKNHPYRENPLLAPCQCTGSMRFVHYLCVEQWRCRSRHPAARNGLNCETCKSPYTLPPPPSRPQDDANSWEAMPPHVLAALRRPHLTWQIMAAIVRRKYLRPLAPILISPLVALYCRARRLLKKRGVSRRRWACSLCGRRARWKCVRCLRSYYCSRQCQNVSWHIVHKHVCYKPTRFWWSVAIYGIGTLAAFPGILKDPILYDLGIFSILISFTVTGIIAGGLAQCLKKCNGHDIRGRTLEASVVASTLFLAHITWNLIWAFFGQPQSCTGTTLNTPLKYLLSFHSTRNANTTPITTTIHTNHGLHLKTLHSVCWRPAKVLVSMLDRMILRFLGPTIAPYVCNTNTSTNTNSNSNIDVSHITNPITDSTGTSASISSCLRMAQNANPDFWMEHENCKSDLNFIIAIYAIATIILLSGHYIKRRERQQRRAAAAAVAAPAAPPRIIHHARRPHQD